MLKSFSDSLHEMMVLAAPLITFESGFDPNCVYLSVRANVLLQNVSRGASRTGVVHIEVWAALRTPVAFESSVAPVLPFNLDALT